MKMKPHYGFILYRLIKQQKQNIKEIIQMIEWEKVLADSARDGTIKELHLRKLPLLKTTANWKNVELVGWVDHQMKYTHYQGGLVKVNGKLYFVQEKTIQALREFMTLKFPRRIVVIPD